MSSFTLSLLCALLLFPVSLAALRGAARTNIFEQQEVLEPAFTEIDYLLPESQNSLQQFEKFSASKPMITTSNDRQVSVWEAIDDFESYKSSIHYSTR